MSLRKFCSPTAPVSTAAGETNPLHCRTSPECPHFWYYDFRVNRCRYRSTTDTANKQLAKQIEARERARILEGRHGIRKQPDISFRAFADEYLRDYAALNKRSVDRDREFLKVLNRAFGSLILHEISAHRVEQFKRERLAGKWRAHGQTSAPNPIQPGTVNRELDTLRAIFSKAVEWGKLLDHPMRTVRRLKVDNQRTRTETEQLALLEACPRKLKLLVRLALITGARIGELLALTWEDVSETEMTFLETKNGRARRLPISAALRAVLDQLHRRAGRCLFTNARTQAPYTVNGVAHVFRRAVVRAGITTSDVTLHTLRHTALSRMIAAGFDDFTVMAISGYRSVRMLERYTHPTDARKSDALDSFSAIGDGQNLGRMETARRKKDGGRQEARTPDLRVANTAKAEAQAIELIQLTRQGCRSRSYAGTRVFLRRRAWACTTDGHVYGHTPNITFFAINPCH